MSSSRGEDKQPLPLKNAGQLRKTPSTKSDKAQAEKPSLAKLKSEPRNQQVRDALNPGPGAVKSPEAGLDLDGSHFNVVDGGHVHHSGYGYSEPKNYQDVFAVLNP